MRKEFKIGDKVIALTNPADWNCQQRKKGQIYSVEAVLYCSNCGHQRINIGGKANGNTGNVVCADCGNAQSHNSLGWTHSKFFAKVDEIGDLLNKALEEENYELCSVLTKIKEDESNA